jgi:hypothetical protein
LFGLISLLFIWRWLHLTIVTGIGYLWEVSCRCIFREARLMVANRRGYLHYWTDGRPNIACEIA